MKHVSLQICERSQERKEQIGVFAVLEALGVPRGGSRNAPLGLGRMQKGLIPLAWRGSWNTDLSRSLSDLFYCLYDVIIILNASDLIFLATPIPFRKHIPFHGSVLCPNIPGTEDQTNLISLMPLLASKSFLNLSLIIVFALNHVHSSENQLAHASQRLC